ncbi:DUF6221 family protein [Streptomyces sp. AMCC400023]|uniref:DUF6221 family protein n=1 Tax=Streptomyces sp. AMCC400023 TaxID=2056258 RepID=UPI001F2393EE|nr:DUF6221 family protein [Streptomyces sp. AMCC400023]UJV42054.1 hypothetical protein CVT30_21370 [Streptomyces sp. AMCC400023]
MVDLVQWLAAQLDEDEQKARDATPGPWWHNPGKQWLGPEAFEKYDLRQGEEFVGYGGPHPFTGAVASTGPASNMQGMKDAAFIAAWDPARVLREIDAKRDLLRFAEGIHDHHETFTTGVAARLEQTLRLFALAYADRPGYREEWAP